MRGVVAQAVPAAAQVFAGMIRQNLSTPTSNFRVTVSNRPAANASPAHNVVVDANGDVVSMRSSLNQLAGLNPVYSPFVDAAKGTLRGSATQVLEETQKENSSGGRIYVGQNDQQMLPIIVNSSAGDGENQKEKGNEEEKTLVENNGALVGDTVSKDSEASNETTSHEENVRESENASQQSLEVEGDVAVSMSNAQPEERSLLLVVAQESSSIEKKCASADGIVFKENDDVSVGIISEKRNVQEMEFSVLKANVFQSGNIMFEGNDVSTENASRKEIVEEMESRAMKAKVLDAKTTQLEENKTPTQSHVEQNKENPSTSVSRVISQSGKALNDGVGGIVDSIDLLSSSSDEECTVEFPSDAENMQKYGLERESTNPSISKIMDEKNQFEGDDPSKGLVSDSVQKPVSDDEEKVPLTPPKCTRSVTAGLPYRPSSAVKKSAVKKRAISGCYKPIV